MVAEAGGEKGENHGNSNLVPSGGRGDENRNTDYEGDADEESMTARVGRGKGVDNYHILDALEWKGSPWDQMRLRRRN